MSLMTTRRFAPLFWCQFFAAFGDNFLKTALDFVILYEVSGANSAVLITVAGATLIAPFFFLSGLGGELADRYDKAFVAQRIKLTEIGKQFAELGTDDRKRLFQRQLLTYVPLAAHIRHVLQERANHTAPKSRFFDELEDYMSAEDAELTLRAVIGWGRYAEVFAYDDDSGTFSLENPT